MHERIARGASFCKILQQLKFELERVTCRDAYEGYREAKNRGQPPLQLLMCKGCGIAMRGTLDVLVDWQEGG
jgi:hypothetical protein